MVFYLILPEIPETGIQSRDKLAYRMLIVHVKGTNNIFYVKINKSINKVQRDWFSDF